MARQRKTSARAAKAAAKVLANPRSSKAAKTAAGSALSQRAPKRGPRPVKWCTRLSASSSLDVYAAAAIAITSSGSSTGGSVRAFVIDSALM